MQTLILGENTTLGFFLFIVPSDIDALHSPLLGGFIIDLAKT